eukprot:CAMPEP_0194536440 /NCGR_PEP_ID=MMETSP0253-20130528/75389_1 /TAXON_ID=2966 /ORGANISM="Noctiluca scintillans" /LENGTH=52 /DNA_ID=CAMNT_0039382371 /DNA_START=111 /DNA_END=265 /DNA_ORIENTATION=+
MFYVGQAKSAANWWDGSKVRTHARNQAYIVSADKKQASDKKGTKRAHEASQG